MRVVVNGQERSLPTGATVTDVVTAFAGTNRPDRLAVAVNGEVVPRRQWPASPLADGDRIELLGAIQGG